MNRLFYQYGVPSIAFAVIARHYRCRRQRRRRFVQIPVKGYMRSVSFANETYCLFLPSLLFLFTLHTLSQTQPQRTHKQTHRLSQIGPLMHKRTIRRTDRQTNSLAQTYWQAETNIQSAREKVKRGTSSRSSSSKGKGKGKEGLRGREPGAAV